jgi:hypothetical protein
MCNKHLLGEHGEIHKHRHNFEKKHSIKGRIEPVTQIEPVNMAKRHDELVDEMQKRGMNHKSLYELPDLSYLPEEQINAKVNLETSFTDLMNRCLDCKRKMGDNYGKKEC